MFSLLLKDLISDFYFTITGLVKWSILEEMPSNKIKKMSSFKSNENIHKKEDVAFYVVSANKASSVTL